MAPEAPRSGCIFPIFPHPVYYPVVTALHYLLVGPQNRSYFAPSLVYYLGTTVYLIVHHDSVAQFLKGSHNIEFCLVYYSSVMHAQHMLMLLYYSFMEFDFTSHDNKGL